MVVVLWLGARVAGAASDAAPDADVFLERFAAHIAGHGDLDEQARSIIKDALDGQDTDDPEAILIEALVVVSPPFLKAMDHYDADEYAEALAGFEALADSDDPYIRDNARAYAVRAMVAMDQLVKARGLVERILEHGDDFGAHCPALAEMVYLLGYTQVQLLDFDQARQTLERFLAEYPDAPRRFVVTARQMLAELARRIPESIGEVADLMQFSEKRLANADTGEPVQKAQQRVLDLLDQLIDDAQKREQQAQQSSQSKSQSQRSKSRDQKQSQPQQSQNPAQQSQLDKRRADPVDKRPGRVIQPGEAWGAMPDAQREKVLQVLRDGFPGRYRKLVEQYYESLAEQP